MRRRNIPGTLLAMTLGLLLMHCQSSPPVVDGPAIEAPALAKEAPPVPAFEAVYNGTPIPYKTMVAYTHGGKGLRLALSSAGPVCDDYRTIGRSLVPNEKTMALVVAPKLAKDGTSKWRIRSLSFEDRSAIELEGVEVLADDATGEVRVLFNVQKDFEASEFLNREAGSLSLRGEMVATGCGVVQKDADAKTRPQDAMVATLANQKLTFEGATLGTRLGRRVLRLSTQPHSCIPDSEGTDLFVVLGLDDDATHVISVLANGDFIDQNINVGFKPGAFPITVQDGASVREKVVTLAGAIDLGPVLSLKGKVTAQKCR